ncbi:iron-sulfur cluster biosynthesis family protein [Alkalihalobacillus hemicellulosilyticus]|uniref:iron-sulfur cluster biosynthesis family protein n=1 Tax=Halalkalibacter hemicellulosilyticus TaxID=127886 RepID=UPI00130DCDF3|nr:iron-sulfur cluster biosynthesis family protein [Halalkalibacter hemicellulosilyticus]
MDIQFTEQAIHNLLEKSYSNYICIMYEVGGCGSPLDGTIHLQLTKTIPPSYVTILTNWVPIYTERSTLMFLEDKLTIDYQPSGYLVRGNNQLYGYSSSIENKHDS